MPAVRTTKLPLRDQKVLWGAASILEGESFVGRVSELSGEPITQVLHRLPYPITRRINGVVRVALQKALDLALYNFDSGLIEPGLSGFKVLSGIRGAASGFFGLTTLPLELPVTTMLMLRSIANIARRYGEDVTQPATRLACLEVLALGPTSDKANRAIPAEASYYAIRAFLARTVSQAAEAFAERGVTQKSAPIVAELVTAIGSRFGLVVSDKVAAEAIPIAGALGGAAVNLAFMDYFQRLAQAHFAIRRLERQYGQPELVRMYALFAMCVAEGVLRDIMALVFKRWRTSFTHAQTATLHARQLLGLNANAYDAYFVIGFSEHLIQKIPATFRLFTKIPGIVGENGRAIRFLEAAERGGCYFREFARQTLLIVYSEEGRQQDVLRTLEALTREFPGNEVYRAEWLKLTGTVRN
jgi:hypothetical protein